MRLPPATTVGRVFLLLLLFSFSEVAFVRVSRSPLVPLSVSFASVAGVALLLCANSALIQKLFYAVKRTCDRQRGRWGSVEGGGGGGGGRQDNKLFRYSYPWPHAQQSSVRVFKHGLPRQQGNKW